MPDTVVRIYLYLLLGGSILFSIVWVIIWIAQPRRRHSLFRTKNLIRDLLFIASGLTGFYIFSGRLLNNWLIMALMSVLVIGSAYLIEAIAKLLAKRFQNNGAT